MHTDIDRQAATDDTSTREAAGGGTASNAGPAQAPDTDFTLQVRRLASEIWREQRPVGANPEQLAAWERDNTTSALFRAALVRSGRASG